jgi:asparagine synthase (glutamine-hydrolysing)
MSALAGILNFGSNPAPVDEYALARMGAALNARGPDGGHDLVAQNIGMSYRAFHTNRESRGEAQPLVNSAGHMLTWNGRLDNREELISQLRGFLLEARHDIPDVNIVMAAYEKWNEECFVRLIGDFSLALWDGYLKILYLVRDAAGTRPLKYHIDDSRILWSTETSALLNVLDGSVEIEENFIADAMSLRPSSGITPFKNIKAIEAAHVLTLTAHGRLSIRRFWSLDPAKEIRYRTDEEYEEHGRFEFMEAVRCRLRADRPVFAELSGGLDSSSIVCLADKVIAEGRAQTSRVETVSHVFDDSPTSDERRFISLVETQRGIRGHHMIDEEHPLLTPLPEDIRIVSPNPIVLSYGYHSGVGAAMAPLGARVLLSGLGGDQMFGGIAGAYPEVADHLVSLRLIALHRSLRAWSRARKRAYLELLWKDAIVRLFPRRFQAMASKRPTPLPPWYSRGFVSRMKLHDRAVTDFAPKGFRKPSAKDQARGFVSTVNNISACWRNEQFGIEVTYPYVHRPLVEFLQAIPLDQLVRPGRNRVLMRQIMTGILPAEIAERRTKGNPSEAIFRAVGRESERLRSVFENSSLCARGYIEKEPFLAALDRARHGYEMYSAFLVQTISLEFWLRGLEEGPLLTRNLTAVPRKLSWEPAAGSVSPAV